ncbi:MAG: phosphonate metabolism protein/1,5-bisphosphokinase (PRPP-forming) PhnN [Pseudomonadota bacterium]
MTGRFIAVVGPSGVGKDTVMEALAASMPSLTIARRTITRPSDVGGETFNSVSPAEFAALKSDGAFALDWAAHGLQYAIPASIDADLKRGGDVLANLSRSVLVAAGRRFEWQMVMSLTARPEALRARLMARGRETAADIEARLSRPASSMPSGLNVVEIDNSGALEDTLSLARTALFSVRA